MSLQQPSVAPEFSIPHEDTIRTFWDQLATVQRDSHHQLWFKDGRYDEQIQEFRDFVDISELTSFGRHGHPEGLRNQLLLRFYGRAAHAIIYGQQVDPIALENSNIQASLALGLQYAATATLAESLQWLRKGYPHEQGHVVGLINELTPIALLNRPAVVEPTGILALPASFRDDHTKATDITQVNLLTHAITPIQAKTRWTMKASIPVDGVMIDAKDFKNEKTYSTSHLLIDEMKIGRGSKLGKQLDAIAMDLHTIIQKRLDPAVQKRDRAERKDIRVRNSHLSSSIGSRIPELQLLRDQLTEE